MRYLAIPIVVVVAVCAVGCTTVGSTPATAPDTSAVVATTSTSAPDVATTSTIARTTTTMDRVAEITAIFEDLERRRLDAIYSGDVEAFKAVFANSEYHDRKPWKYCVNVEPGDSQPSRSRLPISGDCVAALCRRDRHRQSRGRFVRESFSRHSR
jgi:hypothetical protein